ncbi:MAG: hypothetical protein A2176_13140 [Spirochaetes bacterium RBG_13_51_14]|nr:MAG: hypothetical protein A2176_13140 [Spirochaetes bacterium RBG_13_51_14]
MAAFVLLLLIECRTYRTAKETHLHGVNWPAHDEFSPSPHHVFGEPVYKHHDACHNVLLTYQAFTVYYDDTVLAPRWAAIKLTSSIVDANSDFRRPARFKTDPHLKFMGYQYTTHDDYDNVDAASVHWDRGHMIQFDDARGYGDQAGLESMYTTNICPQLADLNQNGWLSLENRMTEFARDYRCVWIIVGPVYEEHPQPYAEGRRVPAPSSFYRIAVRLDDTGAVKAVAFIMPQEPIPRNADLTRYISCIDDIEKMTGIDFFHELPDEIENRIESEKGEIWPH